MTDPTHLASDPVATPKTDARVITLVPEIDGPLITAHKLKIEPFVAADFARGQERRIMELESAVQEIAELISGHDGYVFDDIAKVLLGTRP
jgi:hypothetical protein